MLALGRRITKQDDGANGCEEADAKYVVHSVDVVGAVVTILFPSVD